MHIVVIDRFVVVMWVLGVLGWGALGAEPNTIYELQYTTDMAGVSDFDGQVVDCRGGVVTAKYDGFRPKFFIEDPNCPDGWGAIQVKDWLTGSPIFDAVAVGDWVSLRRVAVEEYRGTTFLQCYGSNGPSVTVEASGVALPGPLEVEPNDIAAPVADGMGGYYVAEHSAERYESMRLVVRQVVVTAMDMGKARDNYRLERPGEPNEACWGADYMNVDASGLYHAAVLASATTGRPFCRVEGVLEQYTNGSTGYDYYQLLPMSGGNLIVPPLGDLDDSCSVDLRDLSLFGGQWLAVCSEPNWCEGADLLRQEPNSVVDAADLAVLGEHWLVTE